MIRKMLVVASVAAAIGSVAPASAAVQLLSWGGNLDYGSTYGTNPFAPNGTDLTNKTYSVVLSYDPVPFTNNGTCGAGPNTSCSFNFTAARPLTATVTVGSASTVYTFTSGQFDLSSGGNDNWGFNFNQGGVSFSGFFQDSNSFYPTQSNVNVPLFSTFTNLSTPGSTFQLNASGFSFGDSPAALTSGPAPVPEPKTWAMMTLGFGLVGGAMRIAKRRKLAVTFG